MEASTHTSISKKIEKYIQSSPKNDAYNKRKYDLYYIKKDEINKRRRELCKEKKTSALESIKIHNDLSIKNDTYNKKRRESYIDRKDEICKRRNDLYLKKKINIDENKQTISFPPIITDDIKKTYMTNFKNYMENLAFKFHVCCICGQKKQVDHIGKYYITSIQSTLNNMQSIMKFNAF